MISCDCAARDREAPAEDGDEREPVQGVARGEQQGGSHRRRDAAPGAEHADDRELRGAREDEHRHRAGLRDGEPGGDGEHAVGDGVGAGREPDRERVAPDRRRRHAGRSVYERCADGAFASAACIVRSSVKRSVSVRAPSVARTCGSANGQGSSSASRSPLGR